MGRMRRQWRNQDPPSPPPSTLLSGDQMECQRNLTDYALNEQLERSKSHLVKLGPHLPDKGERLRCKIASLETEKQRRALRPSKMLPKNQEQGGVPYVASPSPGSFATSADACHALRSAIQVLQNTLTSLEAWGENQVAQDAASSWHGNQK